MNDELQLIKAAQKDKKKFDKLFDLYFDKIRRYVKSKVNYDEYIADDITSSTFEKALKNIGRFKWQGISFSAWIYKIANNNIIDHYRREKNNVSIESGETLKDKSNTIEETSTKLDSDTRIRILIEKLPKRERDVIILKFFEGYTNKSISKKLRISETNVGTIIYRTMSKLRKLINLSGDIDI